MLLDSASMVGSRTPSATTLAAGQAGDDDAEEGDDGVDDGVAGGSYGADDGHDAVAYRAEDGLDLECMLARVKSARVEGTYAGYDGAHFDGWSAELLRVWVELMVDGWSVEMLLI